MYYLDGEIRDTLSTHVAADHGADLIISSYSLQPYHYTEEIGSLHRFGIPVILNQALYQVIQQKIDRHIQHQSDIRAVYNAIDGYFKQMSLPDEHREKILELFEVAFTTNQRLIIFTFTHGRKTQKCFLPIILV